MKRRIAIGVIAAVVLLSAVVALVGEEEVFEALAEVDPVVFSIGFVATAASLGVRSLVWIRFLRVIDRTLSPGSISLLYVTGMFLKSVTPYGQVATVPVLAYLVAGAGSMDYEDAFAGVGAGDVLNYLPYYSLGAFGLAYVLLRGAVDPDLGGYLAGLGVLALLVVGLTLLVLYRRPTVVRTALAAAWGVRHTIGSVSTRVHRETDPERFRGRLDRFYAAIDRLGADRRSVLAAVGFAHAGVALVMLPVYTTAVAVGVSVALPAAALVAALGRLGALFPAPGGLGGTSVAIAGALHLVAGVDPALAVVVGALYRACTYGFTVVVGGCAAVYLSFAGLR